MNTAEFITLVTIAAAILQIILFFKIWGMTNDVRELRERYAVSNDTNFNFEIRKLLASGNIEKVKELLLNRFYNKIDKLNYSGLDKSSEEYPQIIKNIDDEFNKLKIELEKDFNKIGIEVPENIKQMKSGNEFYELF